jgi:DNA (cytosine-5)-methyltransferase 1
MKILNLYACLGGNRYKWDEVADIDVTAVELDEEAARLYKERFPKDTVIVADAHQYLLDHYKEFDFIWSSPPCPTHSGTNHFLNAQGIIRYPDMKLYEEIILLKTFFKGKYVIENVIPYYEPLIMAQKRERHLYWTNFTIPTILSERVAPNMNMNTKSKGVAEAFMEFHNITELLKKYKGTQDKGKMARNLVDYEAGKTILETALGIISKQNNKQSILNF